jgi:flagellar motor switch protein FliG
MLIHVMDPNKRRADAYRKSQASVPVQPATDVEKTPSTGAAGGEVPASGRLDAAAQARKVAGLLKVGSGGEPTSKGAGKVARFLMAIGKQEAAAILRHLSETEVEAVLREITTISRLGKAEAADILKEFGRVAQERKLAPQGGADVARQMLDRAFGVDVAQMIFERVVPARSGRAFEFLEDLEPQQLMVIAKEESPAAIALIAAHLSPHKAAQLISRLSDEVRPEVVRRIVKMQRVDGDVLTRVEQSLREKIRSHATTSTEEVDGMGTLARILRTMRPSEGTDILRTLENDEPEIFDQIQDRLFTIETLLLIDNTGLQKVLREFSDRDIALILKGKTEEIRARVLENVSDRRRVIIAEEYSHLGPVPRRDVEIASREFLDYLRKMEESGDIVVRRHDDEYV